MPLSSSFMRFEWQGAGGSLPGGRMPITAIEPVGTYAVKLVFSDGHDTGLYAWDYLYELGRDRDELWRRYLRRLEEAGASRDPVAPVRQSGASGAGWKKL